MWLGIQIAGRIRVFTTKDAEETEDSQKYPIVFFRVVRVFRGYLSRWLRAGCSRNQLTANVAPQNTSTKQLNEHALENLCGPKRIQLLVVRTTRKNRTRTRLCFSVSFVYSVVTNHAGSALHGAATQLSSQNGASFLTSMLIYWQKNEGRRMVQSCILLPSFFCQPKTFRDSIRWT